MLGVLIAVQQRDPDRGRAFGPNAREQTWQLVQIDRGRYRAVAQHPLVDFEPEIAWHQWGRMLEVQIVEIVPVLTGNLERVPKTFRRDQRGHRALTFDERVGHQRCAMHDLVDLLDRNVRLLR